MKTNDNHVLDDPRICLGEASPIRDLQFSPDGEQIAVTRGTNVLIYDAEIGEETCLITEHITPTTAIFFNPDGKTVMSTCQEGTICISRTSTGRCIRTIHDYEGDFVAFSPDGSAFAASAFAMSDREGDKVHIFDIATATKRQTLTTDRMTGILDVVFSPDGKTLAVSECQRNVLDGPCPISLWDIDTSARLKTLTVVNGGAYSIVFSPDGRTLADSGGLWDREISLWDIGTGEECRAFYGGYANLLAFSSDGSLLVSGHSDGRVLLWDVTTSELLKTFTEHTAKISGLCFSPDGSTLATGCEAGTVLLWDVDCES